MKVSKEVFEQMKLDISKLYNHYNLIGKINFENLDSKDYKDTWHRLYNNITQASEVKINGKFEINTNVDFLPNGDRLFEYNPKFELLPCGTNDKTLTTALKKAIKEVLS